MVFNEALSLSILRRIFHRKGFDYGIPHKHDTYVELIVRFLIESLEMKDLPARHEFVICRTEICKNPPSLLMPDLNFSFKCEWFASIIPNYLR